MFKRVILSLFREFVICARTDARGVYGMDEALKRAGKV
jgi:2-methylisocitrate lyase-like PEP mutase family enzyme